MHASVQMFRACAEAALRHSFAADVRNTLTCTYAYIYARTHSHICTHAHTPVNIDSALYMWDPDTGLFIFFQTFATSAAADLAWLTLEA